jgi:ribosomal protein L11 methylase PrmA
MSEHLKTGRWFGGDRQTAEQLLGLDYLLDRCRGRSVIDLGCAEGAISTKFLNAGAAPVHGCEILLHRIEAARKGEPRGLFWTMDLNHFRAFHDVNRTCMLDRYEIVLALSIAHKLAEPEIFLDHCANLATRYVALRLPARIINDKRSGGRDIDARRRIEKAGFEVVAEPKTCRDEWLCILEKVI